MARTTLGMSAEERKVARNTQLNRQLMWKKKRKLQDDRNFKNLQMKGPAPKTGLRS